MLRALGTCIASCICLGTSINTIFLTTTDFTPSTQVVQRHPQQNGSWSFDRPQAARRDRFKDRSIRRSYMANTMDDTLLPH